MFEKAPVRILLHLYKIRHLQNFFDAREAHPLALAHLHFMNHLIHSYKKYRKRRGKFYQVITRNC